MNLEHVRSTLNNCGYFNIDRAERDMYNVILKYKLIPTQTSPSLIGVSGRAALGDKTLSIQIILPKTYPQTPPSCRITSDLSGFQTHSFIDPGSGYVSDRLYQIHKWDATSDNLITALTILYHFFLSNPITVIPSPSPSPSLSHPPSMPPTSYAPPLGNQFHSYLSSPSLLSHFPSRPVPAVPHQVSTIPHPSSLSSSTLDYSNHQQFASAFSRPPSPVVVDRRQELQRKVESLAPPLKSQLEALRAQKAAKAAEFSQISSLIHQQRLKIEQRKTEIKSLDEEISNVQTFVQSRDLNDRDVDSLSTFQGEIKSKIELIIDDYATEDCLFKLNSALISGVISLELFLKLVKQLTARQFYQKHAFRYL